MPARRGENRENAGSIQVFQPAMIFSLPQ